MSAFLKIDARLLSAERPPVMLLGGINLVRTLGLAGIPAIVASAERSSPAGASRYAIGRCELPPLVQRAAVVERLLRAARELQRVVPGRIPLFYSDDDFLGIVNEFRGALAERYAMLLNEPSLARALESKAQFQALAERRALPVPRRLDWNALAGFGDPVLAKPKTKVDWEHSAVHRRLFGGAGKARVFSNGAAACQSTLVQRLAEALTFQEYVPGDDRTLWSFHGFADEKSELLEWFTGRKLRTYPPLTGESSCVELAHDDALEALGRKITARLRLKGPFKMDFKRHAESGKLYLLEVNPRFTLWNYLGAKNGVNLAEVAYRYLTRGERAAHRPARTEYRWLNLRLDYKAYRSLAAERQLTGLRWLASLLEARNVCELFSWSDPLPWLAHVRQRLPRLKRRVLRWLSTAS